MKSRPILFSAPMVRAILEGRKTQTRRIVKQRDIDWIDEHQGFREPDNAIRCPYGQPGDQLWMREAWRTVAGADDIPPRDLMNVESFTHYEADGRKPLGMGKLRPSIHMPRWASRITLEIVSVRVERLQDIGYADALAEGVSDFRTLIEPECQQGETADECARRLCWPQRSYRQLWEQINGAGSWEANPWVWCVEFKRIEN